MLFLLRAQTCYFFSFLKPVRKNFKCRYRSEWSLPEGFSTGINVYNSETRNKVPLITKNKGVATWYTCGPTVYSDAHIGHASCYVKIDIIRRIMERFFNTKVVLLMGVTDIDDKIIKRANKENVSIQDITKKYEREFFHEMEALHVIPPSIITRVTQFLPQIIDFCSKLVEKEYAYVTDEGNVYFIVSKVSSEDVMEDVEHHPLIDPLKRDPRDFALWKAAKPGETSWLSPWGQGRPGWHIECSAMASQVFGSNMDIHSGGADLMFPHHSNERSQSESFHGNQQWVNYWFHTGLLHFSDDVKMSKSLGNTITIRDFLRENSPNVFRILCLQSTYRNNIEYSSETVELATNVYEKFHSFLNDMEIYLSMDLYCRPFNASELHQKFIETQANIQSALADDLNTSEAVKCLINLVSFANICIQPSSENSLHFNLSIISVIASYVNRTLEDLGVIIPSKKKLPVLFVKYINVVVKIRSIVRTYAIGRASSHNTLLNIESLMKQVDNMRNELETLQHFCELTNISYDSRLILQTVSKFCDNIYQLPSAVTDCTVENSQLTEKEKLKEQKKIKAPFFQACGQMREEMYSLGIIIKDVKDTSVWLPTDVTQKDIINK